MILVVGRHASCVRTSLSSYYMAIPLMYIIQDHHDHSPRRRPHLYTPVLTNIFCVVMVPEFEAAYPRPVLNSSSFILLGSTLLPLLITLASPQDAVVWCSTLEIRYRVSVHMLWIINTFFVFTARQIPDSVALLYPVIHNHRISYSTERLPKHHPFNNSEKRPSAKRRFELRSRRKDHCIHLPPFCFQSSSEVRI